MQQRDQVESETSARLREEQNAILDRTLAVVLRVARHVDPTIRVTLTPIQSAAGVALDVGLGLDGLERLMRLSARQLAEVEHNPEPLLHEIESTVRAMRQQPDGEALSAATLPAPHGSAEATGDEHPEAAPTPAAEALPHAGGDDHAPHATPAALHAEAPGRTPVPGAVAHAPTVTRNEPRTGHTPRTDADASATVSREDELVLDRTEALARHQIEEIDGNATVAFEQYRWHGDLTLDIAVTLDHDTHRFQVSAPRARILLRAPDILHHDLAGIIGDMHRALGMPAGHH